jgi:hypothetical protein
MREISMKVYKFDELSDSAKKVARQWWREDLTAEFSMIQEDARNFLEEKFGIKVDGEVYWSDPYSQGYHAYFDSGHFKDEWKIIKTVLDEERYAFLEENKDIIELSTINIKGRDRRYTYEINDYGELDYYIHDTDEESQDKIEDLLGVACYRINSYVDNTVSDWLNKYVKEAVDYLMFNDEEIDETIRINEYEFYENGKIYK